MRQLNDIRLRDPFVLRIDDERTYYMYGTNCGNVPGNSFPVFRSRDLQHWEGPFATFHPDENFWADRDYWAPEVHVYRGRYYMFASFKAEGVPRGTQILAADTPVGPFKPWSDGVVTPPDWECLDGTLYVDTDGVPWMVFCHEWLQVHDGGMYAVRLKDDLTGAADAPVLLFHASEAPWAHTKAGQRDFVTDGPFIVSAASGALMMLWSSFGKEGYALGVADAPGGKVTGPWQQRERPFFAKDGGHGMVFETFDGRWMLSLHVPNESPHETPMFVEVTEAVLSAGTPG